MPTVAADVSNDVYCKPSASNSRMCWSRVASHLRNARSLPNPMLWPLWLWPAAVAYQPLSHSQSSCAPLLRLSDSDSLLRLSHLLRFSADLRSSAPALAFALPAPFGAGLVNSSPCAKHRESQSPTGLQRLEDFPLLHMFCCLRGLEFRLPLATGINLNLDSGWNGCPQKRSRRFCQEGDTRHGLLLYIFFRRGMKWQEGCQRPDPAS